MAIKWFAELVKEVLGKVSDTDVDEIEDIVRNTIFHSTLDWQTKAQLKKAIKQAREIQVQLKEEQVERWC